MALHHLRGWLGQADKIWPAQAQAHRQQSWGNAMLGLSMSRVFGLGAKSLCESKVPPHHRAPRCATVGRPSPGCGEQWGYMEHKGHFILMALGMTEELGAWEKIPQRVPCGWAGACLVTFRAHTQILLSAQSGPILTAMSQQRLWDPCPHRMSFLEHGAIVPPMGSLSSRA